MLQQVDTFSILPGDSVTCPQVPLYSGVAVSPSNCSEVASPAGAVCAFSCPRGYRLIGPSSINCTGSGAWSDQSANATCEGMFTFMGPLQNEEVISKDVGVIIRTVL